MTPREIAQSYDALAAHWNSEAFNRSNGIDAHMHALKFCTARGHAIDVGCGSSGRIMDLLLGEGFEVDGLDISPRMLEFAQARHPEQMFHLADICEWTFPRAYDFISAWDSIWHVPLKQQAAVLEKLYRALTDGGLLIFTCGGLDAPDEVTNPCRSQPLYHATPGLPKILKIIEGCGGLCRHLEYDQLPESHLFLIVQKPPPVH